MKHYYQFQIWLLKKKKEKKLRETARELRDVRRYGLYIAMRIQDRIDHYKAQHEQACKQERLFSRWVGFFRKEAA